MSCGCSHDTRTVSFKGNKLILKGNEIKPGMQAPDAKLVTPDMSDIQISSFKGKILVLSMLPSLDTPTCSLSTKKFNAEASKVSEQVEILVASMDLPFAQKRYCGAEGIERVKTASDYKYRELGEKYGAFLPDWGLLARAVFVIDQNQKVVYVEYVSEISEEPN